MNEFERRSLSAAWYTLIAHQLWRRGYSKQQSDPTELGDAIDALCGAVLDYLVSDISSEHNASALKEAETALKYREIICTNQKKELIRRKKEIDRLKAILSAHHIKYKENAK